MKHKVLRPFEAGGGKMLSRGEIVDTDEGNWRPRNVDSLVRRRYLQPLLDPAPQLLQQPTPRKASGEVRGG